MRLEEGAVGEGDGGEESEAQPRSPPRSARGGDARGRPRRARGGAATTTLLIDLPLEIARGGGAFSTPNGSGEQSL
jgi:hypothetical protein